MLSLDVLRIGLVVRAWMALGVLGVTPSLHAQASRPSGRWIGQDGHDYVGPNSADAGSDVQDIHIVLKGLPADRAIKGAVVSGLGGDEWQYQGPFGPWRAAINRKPGGTTADLFVEPSRLENGRPFHIKLTFDDGRTVEFDVNGGRADPNRRMPTAALVAKWLGQDGQDRAGPGTSVGPDGFQDVHLQLMKLSPRVEVQSVEVRGPGRLRWLSGTNPEGWPHAELFRKSVEDLHADLFFNPERDLQGKPLEITVRYANNKVDTARVIAGRNDPKRRVPPLRPFAITTSQVKGRWIGQDDKGMVTIELTGLPRGIVAAALSDQGRDVWVYRADEHVSFDVGPYPHALTFRARSDPTRAGLSFEPVRDESGSTLTLRLLDRAGRTRVTRIKGGKADVALRSPSPPASRVEARPGDDLNDLASRFGTIQLARGTYRLNRPLVLEKPVTIRGVAGSRLVFEQKNEDQAWTTAIKIHAGRTTLEGFAVRFAGPVRWLGDVQYGPAVIGSTDNHDGPHPDPRAGIVLRKLDLEGPIPSKDWEEAPRLIRLATASSGRIEDNLFKGGMIEFVGGPWRIAGNEFRGTVAGTYSFGVFSGHWTHDLVLEKNRAKPLNPSGKTWRFLVLTGSGDHDRIRENTVEGIGPRDDDKVPAENAPEIILTESYSLHFEGMPAAVATDGRILQIPNPQGEPARTGDIVAILSGQGAGTWRRIAQAIDARTYLMDEPLPRGLGAIAIATGFVDEEFRGNTIDTRGSTIAANLVLVGNHFGTIVAENRLLGAGEAFKLTAAPTERPGPWGWSHAPMLGVRIVDNTIVDSTRGGTIAVEHSAAIQSNRGRVYLSGLLKGNVAGAGLTIGDAGSLDPGELSLQVEGNRAGGSGPSALRIRSATINGRAVRDREEPLKPGG